MRYLICLFAVLLCWGGAAPQAMAWFGSSHATIAVPGETLEFASADLKAEARFYQAEFDGRKVKFFVLRSADGKARAALDACDACWPEGKGYSQKGGMFICENCKMQFNSLRIGEKKGGCNPHPLTVREENGKVSLSAAELRAGVRFFKR